MMKLVCLAVFVAVASADVSHLLTKPPALPISPFAYKNPPVTPIPYRNLPVSPVAYKNPSRTGEAAAAILRLESDIQPDGSFQYAYDTENGISAQEVGVLKQVGNEAAVVVQGSFQYPDEAGGVQISYVADENGYQPTGNVLPTPHPIPAAIARAIQFNEAHAKAAPQPAYVRY